jgi:hypothetical protein
MSQSVTKCRKVSQSIAFKVLQSVEKVLQSVVRVSQSIAKCRKYCIKSIAKYHIKSVAKCGKSVAKCRKSVAKYRKVSKNVAKCRKYRIKSVAKCRRVSKSVAEWRKVSQSVEKCRRMSQSVTNLHLLPKKKLRPLLMRLRPQRPPRGYCPSPIVTLRPPWPQTCPPFASPQRTEPGESSTWRCSWSPLSWAAGLKVKIVT